MSQFDSFVGGTGLPGILKRKDLVFGVARETQWMIGKRMEKLRKELHESMSINPFLIPILFEIHNAKTFSDLGELLLVGHLVGGHNTSFGKLIDEKVLPRVFGTHKLDKAYRKDNPPLEESCFNEIDHIVFRDGRPILLSLKASRWTIQLTNAKAINTSFDHIRRHHGDLYPEIVVGVFTGTKDTISDKYDILRGINRGAMHNVIDLTDLVSVHAGRAFWSWLNDGEPETQTWVLEGILEGLRQANCRDECKTLLTSYKKSFNRRYAQFVNGKGVVDWHRLLREFNG